MSSRVATLLLCLCPVLAAAQTPAPAAAPTAPAPERTVSSNTLSSRRLPAVKITFPADTKYVGANRFILYGVADAEQHIFAEADSSGKIKRLYWVQVEGYLPDNQNQYNYKSPARSTVGGLEFVVDLMARNTTGPVRPGSDGESAKKILNDKGFSIPDEVMMVRLVHLTDETKRNELMIIYMEDLSPTGLTSADLRPDGKAADKWADMSKTLLGRAEKSLTITK